MVSGFLGAGKTTSIDGLAQWLLARGQSVGIITNDQGAGLVDTAEFRSRGLPVEEVTGSCICCRFDSLKAATDRIREGVRPDVFLTEPIGSCIDLVATISYPLRRLYGDDFSIAPLSVLVDPRRALRMLDLAPGKRFSRNVRYIFRKQLEDADLIVINKRELLDDAGRSALRGGLERAFPGKETIEVSARSGDGLDAWFERIVSSEMPDRAATDVDFETYARGEARLAWLNATLDLEADREIVADDWLRDFASILCRELGKRVDEIAHLKLTLAPIAPDSSGGLPSEVSAVHLTATDEAPEVTHHLREPLRRASVIVNVRAEGAPDAARDALEAAIRAAPGDPGVALTRDHVEAFRPGKPVPTYRDGGEA